MKKTNKNVSGTSYHLHNIEATYNELVAILGEPTISQNDGEDKVNFMWDMETTDENVFDIYDWKEYRIIGEDEVIEWHIGANGVSQSAIAVIEVQAAIDELRAAKTTHKPRQAKYPFETSIKKLNKDVKTLLLYYVKDNQKIAEIGCDSSIVFFTENEYYLYPEQVEQVLAIAKNFNTIYNSIN